MLTIDAVHLREINLPLAHPFETSFGTTTGRRILLPPPKRCPHDKPRRPNRQVNVIARR